MLSISTLQHVQLVWPFFSLSYESVQHALPCTLEVPSLGFGYPFDGVSSLRTLEASFSLLRSWASPFEAFLQPHDRISCFQPFFRSGAFLTNLIGLLPALQRLLPMWLAVSLFAPECLVRTGTLAPLGVSTFWAFPLARAALESLSLLGSPHIFSRTHGYPQTLARSQGFSHWPIGIFPPKGAPTHLAFFTGCRTQPF